MPYEVSCLSLDMRLHLIPAKLAHLSFKAGTYTRGVCSRSMLQDQVSRLVHTGEHTVGACSILWPT